MEILNIILAALISASGLLVGLLLAKIAKEELKPGKNYFIWLRNILLILAIIFVLYSFKLQLYLFLITGIIITLLILKLNPKSFIGYPILALLFILSIKNTNLFILTSSIIFLYGLPTAALIKIKIPQKRKNKLYWLILDILTIPSFILTKKMNALYHLKFICPLCPESRRKTKDVEGNGKCWWEKNWKKGNYNIPRNFGVKNYIRQYLGMKIDLSKFKKSV